MPLRGNAQALRLLTKVYRVDSAFGMDLMPAVLNTLVKYPVDSTRVDKASADVKLHKLGYYKAEEAILNGAQSYAIGSRNLTRANLGDIQEMIATLETKVAEDEAAVESGGSGRRKSVGVLFRDW